MKEKILKFMKLRNNAQLKCTFYQFCQKFKGPSFYRGLTNKFFLTLRLSFIWDKVFKSGLSKFCGRQSLKNFEGYGLLLKFF